MALFEGRILITDCSSKDDRDEVIENVLNHKSSRATVYIMMKDFRDVQGMRQKFPTTVPFVLVADENIDRTRRLLKLLPRMDHFVNFLGQDLALEFLDKRSDFRIKDVSSAYARSNVIDKILVSREQGIIFNVAINDIPCVDNVIAVGSAATKTIKGNVKKMFHGLVRQSTSSSSVEERKPLLAKEGVSSAKIDSGTTNESSSFRRFIVSLYYFICPCINDARVIIPVAEYPFDLDAKLAQALNELYKSLEADWFRKLNEAKESKEQAISALHDSKEERVEKEYNRLIGVNVGLTSTASANRYQAFVNVRNYIRLEKEKVNEKFDRKVDLLYLEQYYVIVEEQFETLISFWKKMRLRP